MYRVYPGKLVGYSGWILQPVKTEGYYDFDRKTINVKLF